MPRFEPFSAIRYADPKAWDRLIAPPYDVLSKDDIASLAADEHNIVWIDMPGGDDSRYDQAACRLLSWLNEGILIEEDMPSFYIYRMQMTDATGLRRTISGVLGGLEVVDAGAGKVLPHEHTTEKDVTDRLELTKATGTNMSPVWGLSLANGLTDALSAPGETIGSVEVDGVIHILERVSDPERIDQIRSIIDSDDVLIADGHHRYGVSRMYRDLIRKATGSSKTPAERTLTFINELSADQLAIEAIHRIYDSISTSELKEDLSASFTFEAIDEEVEPRHLAEMVERKRLIFINPGGKAEWLVPREGAFDGVRNLDGAWLEHALAGSIAEVSYQHGLEEVKQEMDSRNPLKKHAGAVLIRPTSIEEIIATAREGALMPPKSTFFTPKLRTGLVIRPTALLPEN